MILVGDKFTLNKIAPPGGTSDEMWKPGGRSLAGTRVSLGAAGRRGARSSRAELRLVKGEPRGKGPGRMVSIISINQFLSSLLRKE